MFITVLHKCNVTFLHILGNLGINCISTEFVKRLKVKKIRTFAPVCGLNNIDITLNHKIKTLIANKEKFL